MNEALSPSATCSATRLIDRTEASDRRQSRRCSAELWRTRRGRRANRAPRRPARPTVAEARARCQAAAAAPIAKAATTLRTATGLPPLATAAATTSTAAATRAAPAAAREVGVTRQACPPAGGVVMAASRSSEDRVSAAFPKYDDAA